MAIGRFARLKRGAEKHGLPPAAPLGAVKGSIRFLEKGGDRAVFCDRNAERGPG